jgi:23S rRNA (guanosine2251-2'-O)-methyltransferase
MAMKRKQSRSVSSHSRSESYGPKRNSDSGTDERGPRRKSRHDSPRPKLANDSPDEPKPRRTDRRLPHPNHRSESPLPRRGRKIIPNPSPSAVVEETTDEQNRDDLIFGRHTVIAAMEHERPLNKIWVLPQLKRNSKLNELLFQCKSRGAVIAETTSMRLDQLTQYATHQGLVAQVGACEYVELDELIKTAREQRTAPVLIAIDGITDPHNLGAIIRSAEALGSQGLILPQRRAASVGATVAKVAAGALESLPISRVVNLNRSLETLKSEGFWIYGLTVEAPVLISEVDLSGPIVLLIGAEGKGLSAVTQKHCDGTARVPLKGETQSLNASVATGIGIYEIFRQRLKT